MCMTHKLRMTFCTVVKHVCGDSAYAGQKETIAAVAPSAKDFTNKKGCKNKPLSDEERRKNRTKSSVRAKVEHMFHIIKRQFGFVKVRYCGLDKNANALFALCALANLEMVSRRWQAG